MEEALWRLWASVARSGACEPMRWRRFSLTSSGFDERTCDSSMTLPRALVPAGASLLCVVHTTEMLHPHVGAMETSATMASLSPCPPRCEGGSRGQDHDSSNGAAGAHDVCASGVRRGTAVHRGQHVSLQPHAGRWTLDAVLDEVNLAE